MLKKRITPSMVLIFSIATLSGCTVTDWDFEYAGDQDPINFLKSNYNRTSLDIQISVGSITVEKNSNSDQFTITNKVSIRENSGVKFENAENTSVVFGTDGTVEIKFDSNDKGIQADYKYELVIKVPSDMIYEANLRATTGDVSFSISDSTVKISSIDLFATTGSITASIKDIVFSDSTPKIETTTGRISLTLSNLNYTKSADWDIDATTGDINLKITATNQPSSELRAYSYNVEATTGKITVVTDLHDDFGLKVVTSVTTGNVVIDGNGDTFTSSNFDSAVQKYNFDLTTTTGDITVTT